MPKVATESDLRKPISKKDDRFHGNGVGKMSLDLADLNALHNEIKTIEVNIREYKNKTHRKDLKF